MVKGKKRRNIISFSTFLGFVLVLIGVVFFLWAQDLSSWKESASYFLLGLGAIFFLDTVVRYAQPDRRSFMCFRLTIALLFLSAGGAILAGIASWWPLIPILVGLGIMVNALLRR